MHEIIEKKCDWYTKYRLILCIRFEILFQTRPTNYTVHIYDIIINIITTELHHPQNTYF